MVNNFLSYPMFKLILNSIIILILSLLLVSCSARLEKLGEKILYQKNDLVIKLAIYQEELFLHYSGKVFKILCKSPETDKYSNHLIKEPKWMVIGNGSVSTNEDIEILAAKFRNTYIRSSCINRK